jgi:uncharacterized protein
MTSPMYINSVPVFKQLLNALKAILAQADAHVVANSIEPEAFLQARLYPNMFPLVKQVQIATDFARGISARLAGVEIPNYEGREKSFADLDGLLARTLEFLDSVDSSRFEGSETNEIVLRPGTPRNLRVRPIWPTTACRNFSFMSPLRTRFCATTGYPSASVISWGCTEPCGGEIGSV